MYHLNIRDNKHLDDWWATLYDQDGKPFKPIGTPLLSVPPVVSVEKGSGVLEWFVPNLDDPWKQVQPTEDLLSDFINLDSDDGILAFARTWGVLGLCRHEVPFGHNWGPFGPQYSRVKRHKNDEKLLGSVPCVVGFAQGDGIRGREALERWRHFSKQARAIIAISQQLKEGELPDAKHWLEVAEDRPKVIRDNYQRRLPGRESGIELEFQRSEVARVVNEWLRLGAAQPYFVWQTSQRDVDALRQKRGKALSTIDALGIVRPRPSVVLAVDSPCRLFSVLASQLMFRVTGIKRWGICSYCGDIFQPEKREPKSGQQTFCLSCRGAGVPRRLAQAAYKKRQEAKVGKRKNSQRKEVK